MKEEKVMKKVLSILLVVVILMAALVSCDYEVSIQKKTTTTTIPEVKTRAVTQEDIYYKYDVDWSSDGKSLKLTLKLQANESIKDLVLQINLQTEDEKVLKTITLDVGRVVPGNQYTYPLDISDMTLEKQKTIAYTNTKIIDGYVIIQ